MGNTQTDHSSATGPDPLPPVSKVTTGIRGLDTILHGGLPRGRTILFSGGTGMKTNTFPGTAGEQPFYRLMLFVAGNEPHSVTARNNLDRLCDRELKDRCEVQIVDVLEDFALASAHDIVLTPSLLVVQPEPSVTVIGSLSDRKKVLAAMNL